VRHRVRGLEPEEWSSEVRNALTPTLAPVAALEGRPDNASGRPLAILTVLANQPQLLAPFLAWASALVLEGALPRRDHELLALRTACNCRSEFEWAHHVVYARAAGLTDTEIERVSGGPTAPGWSDHDVALLRVADELGHGAAVSEATWAELAAHYSPAGLVEIPLVVGQYTMLSMLANATGVETEAGDAQLP
jgi:4-carboxymuconolactone decarboxylase